MRDYKKDVSNSDETRSERLSDTVQSNFSNEDIRVILELLTSYDVTEFKLERGGEKLSLKRGQTQTPIMSGADHRTSPEPTPFPTPVVPLPPAIAPQGPSGGRTTPGGPFRSENLFEVRSPMVGTFYRKPAVDASPYVEVGDTVKKGDVLCIVEAMKLMNEIESEVDGRIVQICLEDGQMVEYGEVLFRIEPSS